MNSRIIHLCILAATGIGTGQATILTTSSPFGLGSVGITGYYTIDFNHTAGLSANSPVTTQFSSVGVMFSGNAVYDGNSGGANCNFNNAGGDCIVNFTSNPGTGLTSQQTSSFTVFFTTPQSYVAFVLVTNPASLNTTIQAFRNDVLLDSAVVSTSIYNPDDYFGFYNESLPMDRVTITTTGDLLLLVDNLQVGDKFQFTAIPEPATTGMLALGLGGLGAIARRRRA